MANSRRNSNREQQGQGQRSGMSREEAGRKGGEAPHTCRGRECSQEGGNKSRSNSSR